MAASDLSVYLGMVAEIRVDHAAYAHGLKELKAALRSVGRSANPICLHLIGDTRTGKSTMLEDFIQQHRRIVTPGGARQTVVYAKIPDKGTVKGLLERLLHALGDPYWYRGSETNQTHRLLTLLEQVGCRMIILDEFQHLADKGQKKRLRSTADWLKMLVDSKQWALVAAGLPESASVIQSNRQLRERFDAPIKLPMFDWREADGRRQFRAILKAFQAQLHPFELPDLASDAMAIRMYLATGGRIGIIAKLLDRAIRNAVDSGSIKIPVEDLQKAFHQVVWYAERFPLATGPFGADSEQCRNGVLLHQVVAIANEDSYADGSGDVLIARDAAPPEAPRAAQAKRASKKATRQVKDALRNAA